MHTNLISQLNLLQFPKGRKKILGLSALFCMQNMNHIICSFWLHNLKFGITKFQEQTFENETLIANFNIEIICKRKLHQMPQQCNNDNFNMSHKLISGRVERGGEGADRPE